MGRTCDTHSESFTSRFVVRHTFIDVVDVPEGGRVRARAKSESNLYSRCGFEDLPSFGSFVMREPVKEERAGGKVDVELGGLSDAETTSLHGEQVGEGRASDTQSEASSDCGAASTPRSQWSNSTLCRASSSSSSGQFDDLEVDQTALSPEATSGEPASQATTGQPSSRASVELLLSENLRLQLENKLLRERCAAAPAAVPAASPPPKAAEPTTVMLRNLPNNYTRAMLLKMLDEEGFAGLYDFLYLPIDFKSGACLGYAFINLVDAAVVAKFWGAFDGYRSWAVPSKKVCHLSWSGPHQGLQAHVARYRNSPIMHKSVPDECKPMVFHDGVRVAFPDSTKATKAPRVRTQRPRAGDGRAQPARRQLNRTQ